MTYLFFRVHQFLIGVTCSVFVLSEQTCTSDNESINLFINHLKEINGLIDTAAVLNNVNIM